MLVYEPLLNDLVTLSIAFQNYDIIFAVSLWLFPMVSLIFQTKKNVILFASLETNQSVFFFCSLSRLL